jgi:hypothetical protein
MNAVHGPEIEVISGLASPSAAENMLLAALRREVRISLHRRLDANALGHCRPDTPLLLVVPVLGDNNLHDTHFAALTGVSQNRAFASKKIVIVLHGDRHVWDAPRHCDPVNVKLKNAFYFSTDLHLHPEKLDISTATLVAQPVLAQLRAVRAEHLTDLGAIAMALGKAPDWDAAEGKLDFYDVATGFSRLYGMPLPSRVADAGEHASGQQRFPGQPGATGRSDERAPGGSWWQSTGPPRGHAHFPMLGVARHGSQ